MSWNLDEAIGYYTKQGAPADQSALIALLREIQREQGGSIPHRMVSAVAEKYRIRESLLLALVRRIPSLKLEDSHCLELCAGPNCGKHPALAAAAEELQRAHPGRFVLKFTPCMRMCGKGPNLRWDGQLYHRADEKLLRELVEGKITK